MNGDAPQSMAGHVRVLGFFYVGFSALVLLGGMALFVIFGGAAGIVSLAVGNGGALLAAPVLTVIGVVLAGLAALLAVPGLLAGFGLLGFRPWARILTIVLSALELLNFPLGTILGAYGLWVLLHPHTEALFRMASADR